MLIVLRSISDDSVQNLNVGGYETPTATMPDALPSKKQEVQRLPTTSKLYYSRICYIQS